MLDFKPIEFSRKEKCKCTYYELYSIKNQRNIQLYSQQCYYQALILEMDYRVSSYCERPCKIGPSNNDNVKSKIIDFIVEYTTSKLLEMQRVNYHGEHNFPLALYEALKVEESWCHSHGYRYQIITFDEAQYNSHYFHNIKYLYGLVRRINSPIYSKYTDLFVRSLQNRKAVSISDIIDENHLSKYEALQAISFGIYRGLFTLFLEYEAITTDMEVKLVSNENCI